MAMSAPARTVTILVVLAFVAFLLWTTLASQRIECTVAVEFRGARRTATATAASEGDASREAQTTACGPLAGTMDERLACAGKPPVSRNCRPI
jgi:hypothetical protein